MPFHASTALRGARFVAVVRMNKNASQGFCVVNVHPLQPVVGASENEGLRCQVSVAVTPRYGRFTGMDNNAI